MSPEPSLPQVLRNWIEVFMQSSFRDFKRFMDDADLSPSQVNALMRLHNCGMCGVTDIADHLGFTKPAASQMIDRLVQQGLLKRSEDPDDRRVKQVTLTPDGQALVEAGIQSHQRWMEQLTASLTPAEQKSIGGALILLTEAARKLQAD